GQLILLMSRFVDVSAPASKQPESFCANGSNAVETEGRAVDGRLAHPDADRRGGRPRGNARAQCFSDHGDPLQPWLADALSPRSRLGRVGGAEDIAALDAYGTRPHSLHRPAWLVLCADAHSDRTGGLTRVHHADLDRHPRGDPARRT